MRERQSEQVLAKLNDEKCAAQRELAELRTEIDLNLLRVSRIEAASNVMRRAASPPAAGVDRRSSRETRFDHQHPHSPANSPSSGRRSPPRYLLRPGGPLSEGRRIRAGS
jgi:hypothetical protein